MKVPVLAKIIFESGWFDEFNYNGPFIVLVEFDSEEAMESYKAWWLKENPGGGFREVPSWGLPHWLRTVGYIEECADVLRWSLGEDNGLRFAETAPKPLA